MKTAVVIWQHGAAISKETSPTDQQKSADLGVKKVLLERNELAAKLNLDSYFGSNRCSAGRRDMTGFIQ